MADAEYEAVVTRDDDLVRQAQQLRQQVFGEEFGLSASADGVDSDACDRYADHVVVRHRTSGEVVGTYRMLTPAAAARAGGNYSDQLFDLRPLRSIQPRLLELGRACVHPEHRNGVVISLLWMGLVAHAREQGLRWLAGCCSVPLADGGVEAARIWATVAEKHLAPPERLVAPRREWVVGPAERIPERELPALLKAYLRLGAQVCGKPAHDPDFDTADLYVLLDLDAVPQRYLARFERLWAYGRQCA